MEVASAVLQLFIESHLLSLTSHIFDARSEMKDVGLLEQSSEKTTVPSKDLKIQLHMSVTLYSLYIFFRSTIRYPKLFSSI
jgi:hypothetical protein